MPELPAVLRRTLPAFDQAVLTAAAEGGPDLVRKTVDGIRSLEHAEETIARVRRSAAVVIERTRERNGTPRDVVIAALEAAGVPAEEAGTILADGEGAGEERIPEGEPPPLPPAPEPSGVTVPSSREEPVSPAPRNRLEESRKRRDRIVELLEERPRSIKALAVELGVDITTVRNALGPLGSEGRAMATTERAFDWPGAVPGKGRPSVVWGTKDFAPPPDDEPDEALLARAAVTSARLADRLAGVTGDELGRAPIVVGPLEVAGVVERLGDVQDRVPDEPEPPAEVQDLVVPDAPAAEPVQDLVEPAAARRLLARCAESRRAHAALAQEVAQLAAEMVEAAEGELPEGLLCARYLAALLRRIEAGDTSSELLDRFERVAGLHDGR